jgi:pimeloyl-ACP methyl ester carboxylesterase
MTSTENRLDTYADAPNASLSVGGITYAYRELGPRGGIPVVLLMHLAGTLDNWDPRIVDAIAAHRHVIAFDQRGVGGSTGRVPRTLEESAEHAYELISALGYDRVDVVGFSMGAMIAQDLVLAHPDLVRRLVLTGTGPRGGEGIDKVVLTTYLDILRAALTRSDPKEFLFFERDDAGRAAGRAFVARLRERTTDLDAKISLRSLQRQLRAIVRYGRSAPSDLSTITAPTLIANGDHDRMVPSVLSEDLHRRIAGSELVIYPGSGHGAVFQYHERFAPLVVDFLGSGEKVEP